MFQIQPLNRIAYHKTGQSRSTHRLYKWRFPRTLHRICHCSCFEYGLFLGPNKPGDVDSKLLCPMFDIFCCWLPGNIREKLRCGIDYSKVCVAKMFVKMESSTIGYSQSGWITMICLKNFQETTNLWQQRSFVQIKYSELTKMKDLMDFNTMFLIDEIDTHEHDYTNQSRFFFQFFPQKIILIRLIFAKKLLCKTSSR